LSLSGYSDVNWASNVDDKKNTNKECFYIGGNLAASMSKKQNPILLSTTKVENIAADNYYTQLFWKKKILEDHVFSQDTMTIYCDNSSAISISKNLVQHSRTNYIDITHHFIRDLVELKIVSLEHVNIKNQLADLFTKPLDGLRFKYLRKVICVCEMP
jgi:hypothetical protein